MKIKGIFYYRRFSAFFILLFRLPLYFESKSGKTSDEANEVARITKQLIKLPHPESIKDIKTIGKNTKAKVSSPQRIKESPKLFAENSEPTPQPTKAQTQTHGITSELGSFEVKITKGSKSARANINESAIPLPISATIKMFFSSLDSGLFLFFFIYIYRLSVIYMSFYFDLFQKNLIDKLKCKLIHQFKIHCGNIDLFDFVMIPFGILQFGFCVIFQFIHQSI